jgi:hypothetical protein
LVAGLVTLIREPGTPEDVNKRRQSRPVTEALREISMMVPPFSMVQLARRGGARALALNLVIFAVLTLAACGSIALTGGYIQWIAAGVALYAVASWAQALLYTDPAMGNLVVKSPTFVSLVLGASFVSILSAAVGFWAVPLAMRQFGISAAIAGAALAPAMAGGGMIGTVVGGFINDRWKRKDRAAALWLSIIAVIGSAIFLAVMLNAKSLGVFVVALALLSVFSYCWPPANAALGQDLILPSMRGRASASMSNTCQVVSMCLGPYTVGYIADVTGSLATGLMALFIASPIAIGFLLFAARTLPQAYARRERAADVVAIEDTRKLPAAA